MKRAKSIITTKELPKQKLTLDIINKNVIQRAKAAGINVSAVTEYLLNAITHKSNDGNTRDDLVRVYEVLLSNAWSLLAKYDQMGGYDIDVGEYGYDTEKRLKKVICFDTLMGLSICYEDHGNPIEADIPVERVLDVLYEPMKIIENIIISLTYAAETNKQRLDQLKSALQLVKTLSDEEEEEEEEGSQTSKERRTATKLNMPLLDMSDKRWCISTNEFY
jgi:post-segregation antitoxin (ccd killing protein)